MPAKTASILIMSVRTFGMIALFVGLALNVHVSVPLMAHILPATLMILSLLGLALMSLRTQPALAVLALAFGLSTPFIGMGQLQTASISQHILLMFLHPVIAVSAIAFAELLAKRIRLASL